MSKKSFYITTTLPYVNAEPHIGHALELIQADVIARWRRIQGHDVFFNTGTDEHGQKVSEAAEKAGKDIRGYIDTHAEKFKRLKETLGLSFNAFIRTTDEKNIKAAQELWQRCKEDIYEKEFEGLYCVGCERFLSKRDTVDGKCDIHDQKEPELLKEKNYFFNFKKYEKELLKYLRQEDSIIPDWRREEAIDFVEEGLEDFSISRDRSRLSWGVPVPGDDTQVMYVWFEALANYIATLGWPDEGGDFKKFWQEGHILQLAGKDQVRFQSLVWQAMLMSADIKNTDTVFYHGFINSGGQKMSKSLGNVINPDELVEKYGTDATRYLLLRHVHSTEDTDITWEKLDEWYTANLSNGLGNLVSRILTLASTHLDKVVDRPEQEDLSKLWNFLDVLEINRAVDYVWKKIGDLDVLIQEKKPWETKDTKVISDLVTNLYSIARLLNSLMPETSRKIKELIKANKSPDKSLFPRLPESEALGNGRQARINA